MNCTHALGTLCKTIFVYQRSINFVHIPLPPARPLSCACAKLHLTRSVSVCVHVCMHATMGVNVSMCATTLAPNDNTRSIEEQQRKKVPGVFYSPSSKFNRYHRFKHTQFKNHKHTENHINRITSRLFSHTQNELKAFDGIFYLRKLPFFYTLK